ncbi:hypothetical protein MAM1_0242c08596 [Mucor ambiguus]|uniref:Uncharacterized protein n=1 Tax=Mucor ambiguus TaxID=91626 RepID=A0A0C9MNJ2_9FUNG|nr:hypothetical protein MAM1_0242c08596 [Mucor ambiguus]
MIEEEEEEEDQGQTENQAQGEASTQVQHFLPSRSLTQEHHQAYSQYQSRESTSDRHQPYQHEFTAPASRQSPSDAPNTFEISSQEDIWSCWERHLADDTLHQYSLERLGIIQCGSNVECNPKYPQELYDLLVFDNTHFTNPVANHHIIFDKIFDSSNNQKEMLESLRAITYDQLQNKEINFVHSIMLTLLSSTLSTIDITFNETCFSYYVVWPLIHAVTKAIDGATFNPGEYYLRAISCEFARRKISNNQHYKADGCISVKVKDIKHELVLLEVSGPFKLENEGRFTKDHVKAGYGLVAMLNQIAYQYEYASFDVLTGVRIYFVHAKSNKLRLWSFEMASPGIYVLNLLDSQTLPDDFASSELAVESLCIELWHLKELLDYTAHQIQLLANSDAQNKREFSRARRTMPDIKPTLLRDSLKIDAEVKLNVDYLKDHQELDICSSLG